MLFCSYNFVFFYYLVIPLTKGGTAVQGTPCYFPFVYKDVTYTNCTLFEKGHPWCSTTMAYSSSSWGYCGNITISIFMYLHHTLFTSVLALINHIP